MNFRLPLILIILLALFLRAPYLTMSFYGDEFEGWVLPAKTFIDTGVPLELGEKGDLTSLDLIVWRWHPPIALLLYAFAYAVSPFGMEVSLRAIPFVLSLASLALLYLIGERLYNKKTALLAVFLAAVSTYHLFHASIRIDIDGGILAFFLTAAIATYLHWHTGSRDGRFLVATGFLLGLALLSRTSAFLVVGFFTLYALATTRHVTAAATLALLPLGIFCLWAGGTLLVGDPEYLWQVLQWGMPVKEAETLSSSIVNRLPGLYTIVRGLSPPLLGLLLLSFIERVRSYSQGNAVVLFPWAFVCLIVFMVVLPSHGEKQRYFTIALPMSYLAVAWLVQRTPVTKKNLSWLVGSFIVYLALFTWHPPYDHMIHEYMLYGSIAPLVVWVSPFALLVFSRTRPIIPALMGCYLAFSVAFLAFDCSANHAYADTVGKLKGSTNVLIANKNNINTDVYGYDWLADGRIDSNNTYLTLSTYQDIVAFERKPACQKLGPHRYPVSFVCPKGAV